MLPALATLCITAARQVLMAGLMLFLICGGFCGDCLAGTSSDTPSTDSCEHAAAAAQDQDRSCLPGIPAADDTGQDDGAPCCGCACICHQASVLPAAPELPVLVARAMRIAYPLPAPCADSADRAVESPPLIV